MSKMLEISSCSECGKWFLRYGYSMACRKLGRKLLTGDGIPDDCPLPDAALRGNRTEEQGDGGG
jgi:hypothetical protein